jgi:hypothetical protein
MELGEKLGPAYASIISKSSLMLKSISGVVDFLIKYGRAITTTITAIAGYSIAVKVAASWTKIQTGYTVAATAAEKVYALAKGVLTGQITLATVAQRAWNLAVKANPIGLLIGLLSGAVVWLISFDKKTGKVSAALHQTGQRILDIRDYFIELYNSSLRCWGCGSTSDGQSDHRFSRGQDRGPVLLGAAQGRGQAAESRAHL